MEIVLGLLWIYGIWDGWKQITGASGLAVCLRCLLSSVCFSS